MRPGKRFGLSAIEKNEIWRRWKAGQTLHEIGRAPLTSHITPFAACQPSKWPSLFLPV